MIMDLVKIANKMDALGLTDFADRIDIILCKIASDFRDQFYSDNDGEYRVGDIYDYAVENIPLTDLSVEELAEINFMPGSEETADELPGSPEFIERADKADLQYPILAIEYPDGIFVADGVHRLWKAHSLGHDTIKGRLLQQKDLERIVKAQDRDMDGITGEK